MYNGSSPVLIVIGGPTASGKTDFAIKLAKYFNTEIISADSRQIYKEINIGTAKPTDEQLNSIKHHFINHCSISENYNSGIFETQSIELLSKLFLNHNVVIAVGGTGLYLKALYHGLDKLPEANIELRKYLNNEFKKFGTNHLFKIFEKADPEGSKIIDSNNPHRIMRAIELVSSTGVSITKLKTGEKQKRNFKVVKIMMDLPRELLYSNINKRTDIMIEKGLEQECRNLFHLKNLNSLKTVGYTEMFDYFEGKCSLPQAIEKIKQHTRNYAKRQITWFKKEHGFISHLDFDFNKIENYFTPDEA